MPTAPPSGNRPSCATATATSGLTGDTATSGSTSVSGSEPGCGATSCSLTCPTCNSRGAGRSACAGVLVATAVRKLTRVATRIVAARGYVIVTLHPDRKTVRGSLAEAADRHQGHPGVARTAYSASAIDTSGCTRSSLRLLHARRNPRRDLGAIGVICSLCRGGHVDSRAGGARRSAAPGTADRPAAPAASPLELGGATR